MSDGHRSRERGKLVVDGAKRGLSRWWSFCRKSDAYRHLGLRRERHCLDGIERNVKPAHHMGRCNAGVEVQATRWIRRRCDVNLGLGLWPWGLGGKLAYKGLAA